MSVNRASYVPSRLDWWFGESPTSCDATIREATAHDVDQIQRMIRDAGGKVSRTRIRYWLSQNNYSVRLVSRNYRQAIALCVSRHGLDGNEILHFVAPVFTVTHFPKVLPRLLTLAAAELPEALCRAVIKLSDESAGSVLRASGWKLVRCDESIDEAEFTFGPCVS